MASCLGNIHTKNYSNPITLLKDTTEKVWDFFGTLYRAAYNGTTSEEQIKEAIYRRTLGQDFSVYIDIYSQARLAIRNK